MFVVYTKAQDENWLYDSEHKTEKLAEERIYILKEGPLGSSFMYMIEDCKPEIEETQEQMIRRIAREEIARALKRRKPNA